MSRNESVRQAVLERDGRRCQICGAGELIEAHHIEALGFGGSVEKDVADNVIALCAGCHAKVHAGMFHIEEFTTDKLVVTDSESRRVPDNQLWFYQRQRVERLEEAEGRLIKAQTTERTMAYDLWELATGDPPGYTLLDGYEGETFSGYVSGRNISVRLANEAVTACSWIKEKGPTWPQGLRLDKVNLVRRAEEQVEESAAGAQVAAAADGMVATVDLFDAQKWLDGAVDPSYPTVKQNLIDAGLKTAQAGWYLVFSRKLLGRKDIVPAYTRDLGKLMDREEGGSNVVIRVWGFKRGLHRDPATGGLKLFGVPLPFEDLTKEEYRLDTPEVAKDLAEAIQEELDSGQPAQFPDSRSVTNVTKVETKIGTDEEARKMAAALGVDFQRK